MKKRNLLNGLKEGLNALQEEREGKLTLKKFNYEAMEAPLTCSASHQAYQKISRDA